MKAIRPYLFVAGLILVLLCTLIPSWRDWWIAWTFNAIYLIDNSFNITGIINPIVLWAIVFLFFGACAGIIRAVNRYKLDKKIKYAGLFGIFLILLLTVAISKPIKHGQSHEFREEMLWIKINKENSYAKCLNYLKEFPDGKYLSQVQVIQEQSLWDSAMIMHTLPLWDLYLELFPSSEKYDQARKYHEKLLWDAATSINNIESYTNYLNQYPNGKYIKKANSAVKRLKKKEQEITDIPVESMADSSIITNESSIATQGVLEYPDGRRFEGTMVNGEPEGKGKEIFTDNTLLEGSWKNGKRNGSFIFHKSDGTTENQEFDNGIRIK